MKRPAALLAASLVLLVARGAVGDPDAGPPGDPVNVVNVAEPFHAVLDSGPSMHFAPSFVVPTAVWAKIDAEMIRLQTVETRLTAENTSLTASTAAAGPGLGTIALIAAALVAGIAAGHYAF